MNVLDQLILLAHDFKSRRFKCVLPLTIMKEVQCASLESEMRVESWGNRGRVFSSPPEHKILSFYKSVWPKTGLNTVSLNWQSLEIQWGYFSPKSISAQVQRSTGDIIYLWSSKSQRGLTYLQTLKTRQKHSTKSLFSFTETLICETQIFSIWRSRNGTKLLYGKRCVPRTHHHVERFFLFFFLDIFEQKEFCFFVCFEQMLNECLFKLEACGPTSCLSWQITDFSWKPEAMTGQRFITVRGAHVMKKDRQRHRTQVQRRGPVRVPRSKRVRRGLDVRCACCVPPRLQTRRGSACFRGIHNDVTDRKRLGKAWHLFGTGRIPVGSAETL